MQAQGLISVAIIVGSACSPIVAGGSFHASYFALFGLLGRRCRPSRGTRSPYSPSQFIGMTETHRDPLPRSRPTAIVMMCLALSLQINGDSQREKRIPAPKRLCSSRKKPQTKFQAAQARPGAGPRAPVIHNLVSQKVHGSLRRPWTDASNAGISFEKT